MDTVITHPDGTMSQGLFQFGLREFETQVPSGKDLLNLADKRILEQPNPLVFTPVLRFNGDDFNPRYTLDPVELDLDLGVIQPGTRCPGCIRSRHRARPMASNGATLHSSAIPSARTSSPAI